MEDLIEIDGMKINQVNDDIFEVFSGNEKYIVMFDVEGNPACTCKGYWYNGHCKHIDAVKKFIEKYG